MSSQDRTVGTLSDKIEPLFHLDVCRERCSEHDAYEGAGDRPSLDGDVMCDGDEDFDYGDVDVDDEDVDESK